MALFNPAALTCAVILLVFGAAPIGADSINPPTTQQFSPSLTSDAVSPVTPARRIVSSDDAR